MIELDIAVEIEEVSRAIERYAAAVGKPIAEVLRQRGRLIAVNLAYQTQPYGFTTARQRGERAVRRDIRTVYSTPSAIYDEMKYVATDGNRTGEQLARAFYKAVARGDVTRAQKILTSSGLSYSGVEIDRFDGGRAHRERRNSHGRVYTGSRTKPSMIVRNPSVLRKYAEKIQKNVGIAKSGFADCARALGGTRGIPQWITRHKKGLGTAIDHTAHPTAPTIIIINSVWWIRRVLTEREISEALRYQAGKMSNHIRIVLEAEARKSALTLATV